MQYQWMLFLLFFAGMALAETQSPSPVQANPNAGLPNKGYKVNPNAVQALDSDFFDSKKDSSGVESAGSRYNGGEPDFNTEQREQWLRTCEKYKGKDMQAYRKCYTDEKTKTQAALKEGFESIERRLNEPLRNTNPLLDEQRKIQSWGEE